MAQIAIHPAVDKGLKPAAKDFAGGTLRCLCASDPVEVVITGQVRAQPRLRLHAVLEAEGGAVRADRGRAARQGSGEQERRQAAGHQPERAHHPPRLPRLRRRTCRGRSCARTTRSRGWSSSTPSCRSRAGLGAARRSPRSCRRSSSPAPSPIRWRAIRARLNEHGPAAVRLPVAGADGLHRDVHGEGVGRAQGLNARALTSSAPRAWWARWSATNVATK